MSMTLKNLTVEKAVDWDDVHKDFFRFDECHLPTDDNFGFGDVVSVKVGERVAYGVARGLRYSPETQLLEQIKSSIKRNADLADAVREAVKDDLALKPLSESLGADSPDEKRIQIDATLRNRLGIELDKEYDFVVSRAGSWGILMWAWSTTDGMTRTAARLAVLSIFLGVIGLVLGAISLIPDHSSDMNLHKIISEIECETQGQSAHQEPDEIEPAAEATGK